MKAELAITRRSFLRMAGAGFVALSAAGISTPSAVAKNSGDWHGVATGYELDGEYGWNAYVSMVGKTPNVRHAPAPWTHLGWFLDRAKEGGAVPMITWQPHESNTTVLDVRNGLHDSLIVDNSDLFRGYGKLVLLRVAQEMNGFWMKWCPFDKNGNYTKGFNTGDFRNMWRRIVLIFRGGPVGGINSRLAFYNMPALKVDRDYLEPAASVRFVWNPNEGSNPNTQANRELAYWPGDEFVDYAGQDFYANIWNTPFADNCRPNLEAHYQEFCVRRGKPYLAGEYGVWNADSAGWLRSVHNWADSRPRVKGLVYYNQGGAAEHHLQSFPKSRAEVRRWVNATA